jgi:hypothetical protein
MRWLLIGLFILNIAVLAWFLRVPPAPSVSLLPATETSGEGKPALQLLTERGVSPASRQEELAVSNSSEATVVAQPSPSEFPSAPLPVTQPEVSPAACYDIGPFADRRDMDQFIAAYQNAFTLVSVPRERQIRTDHRVYLPPFLRRQLAQDALETLRAQLQLEGLAIDTLLITRGEFENGISLGVFSEARNANNVRAQLSRLGYEVQITEEPRMQEELWLSVSETQNGSRVIVEWPAIMRERPLLQRTEKLC